MGKRLKKEILQKLVKKTGNTEGSIRALISSIRRENNGIPTINAAAFLYGEKCGISVMQQLSEEDKLSLSNIPSISIIGRDKKRKSYIKEIILRTPAGIIKDPFLPETIFRDVQNMSQGAYPYFYIFENSLRNFITIVMEKNYKSSWWDIQPNTKKIKEIKERVKKRMEGEEKYSFHSKRGVHPIYYSDFPDLVEILNANKVLFNPYFKNLKGKLDSIIIKLDEIQPSRNISSHHNPLSKTDLNRVVGYLDFWLKQLNYIKQQNLL
ncbi:hypothetical protein AMJ49_02935 [Parcubacteria bacterium DG_74_2]|nr:MAG: hypothetical protein AMJ49_02935 [Parcubacteria bacterium DG_74_2]